MSIINAKRLRDYPRLIFIATWTILLLNLLFRQGWSGLFRQIIGSDFVTLFGAGLVQRTNPANLYNFVNQAAIQQALIKPTTLSGLNPYISPPYVAPIYGLFTYLPLPLALIIWCVISIFITMLSTRLLHHILPESLKEKLGYWQLLIITLSFFPFIEGFQVGQNHTLTLLIVTSVILFTLSERWFLAGIMAGLMLYKPQFVIGFLIIWIIWRKYKALTAFIIVSVVWVGSYLVFYGFSPFQNYLKISQDLVLLPYIPGFPGYLLLTAYGFLSTIFPIEALSIVRMVAILISVIITIALIWLAFTLRNKPMLRRTPAIVLAIIFPLVISPYALLHDLVILIPGFIVWARYSESRNLLFTVIFIYLGGLVLTLLASMTKIALVALLPVSLIILIFLWVHTHQEDVLGHEKR
jgi:alpha-1,2-mannosyltransferase